VTPKAEVKSAKIFTETHPLGVKIDAEYAGAIFSNQNLRKPMTLLDPRQLLFLSGGLSSNPNSATSWPDVQASNGEPPPR
jgi:hypothetical protein